MTLVTLLFLYTVKHPKRKEEREKKRGNKRFWECREKLVTQVTLLRRCGGRRHGDRVGQGAAGVEGMGVYFQLKIRPPQPHRPSFAEFFTGWYKIIRGTL